MSQVDTTAPAGPIASGGHGYNDAMTDPSSESPAEHAAASTNAALANAAAKPGFSRGFWIGLLFFGVVLAGVIVYGIHVRAAADQDLKVENKQEAVPEVKIVHPAGQGASGTLALPGSTQAFVDTPIFSRTNGYLKKWFFDIGARVHKGQLMAVIETPELDQQLQVAQADLKSAQANLDLANITSTR